MNHLLENTYRIRHNLVLSKAYPFGLETKETVYVPRDAKLLAWGIFLIFFIENGTLGLLPPQLYFVYRNMRVSDFLLYAIIIYSLFRINDYADLIKSKALLIPKLLLGYYLVQFIASVLIYQTNIIEYFFRLKMLWFSFMIFPFLLLLKRGGVVYMIKIFFVPAVAANILYILTSITGVIFIPGTSISQQILPGGIVVNRVFGSTFYGEFFFFGFVYLTLTRKFRPFYLVGILFIIPDILALGRGAWVGLSFTLTLIFVWNILKKREFKVIFKQILLIAVIIAVTIYGLIQILPDPESFFNILNLRVMQGTEDYKYSEGTYRTRMENNVALTDLWLNTNVLFGVGMAPFWVIKPETTEETIYLWGFSDLRWSAVLAAYGLIGFLLAAAFQIYFLYLTFRTLKRARDTSIGIFFVLMMLGGLIFDTFINFTLNLISVTVYGIAYMMTFYISMLVYEHEKIKKIELQEMQNNSLLR